VFRKVTSRVNTELIRLCRVFARTEARGVPLVTQLGWQAGPIRDSLGTLGAIATRKGDFQPPDDMWADAISPPWPPDANPARHAGGVRERADPWAHWWRLGTRQSAWARASPVPSISHRTRSGRCLDAGGVASD